MLKSSLVETAAADETNMLCRLTACVNTVVLARVVSATPPSIAIEALVLGGPERVRVCVSQQQQQHKGVHDAG